MAAKVVIGATLQADGSQANETVKSFKAQLREANQELLKMQEEFGELSAPAIQAAKKVAELKDTIGDAQSLVDTFNPDRKFQAFGQSVQGVVGGFSALQGVMALIGSESEDVEKALLKVQAAMAISQGLDDIRESVQGFKNLAAQISGPLIKAFGSLRAAMLTSGIGAAVIAIGYLIANMGKLNEAFNPVIRKANELEEATRKQFEASLKAVEGFDLEERKLKALGVAEKEIISIKRQRALEALKAADAELKALDTVLQATARSYAKNVGLSASGNPLLSYFFKDAEDLNEVGGKIDEVKRKREELSVSILEFSKQITDIDKKTAEDAADEAKKIADKATSEMERKKQEVQAKINEAKKLNEELKNENEVSQSGSGRSSEIVKLLQEYEQKAAVLKAGNQSLLELDMWFNEQKKAIDKKYWEEEQQRRFEIIDAQLQKEQEAAQKQIDSRNQMYQSIKEASANLVSDESLSYDMRRQLINEAEQKILSSTQYTEEQKTAMAKGFSDARKTIDEKEAEHKYEVMNQIASLGDIAADLAGKQTVVGKGLAVAATTISTYASAQKAYESQFLLVNPTSPVLANLAAAAAILQGLARVKAIASVKIPGKGGGGGSISAPSLNTAAPLRPQLAAPTQLDQSTINAIGNQAVRAYVVESDVSNDQEKIRRLNRAARL